jgi:hypothetical protein
MNAGTCWGKNTIGPSGQSVERPRDVTLPLLFSRRTRHRWRMAGARHGMCELTAWHGHSVPCVNRPKV